MKNYTYNADQIESQKNSETFYHGGVVSPKDQNDMGMGMGNIPKLQPIQTNSFKLIKQNNPDMMTSELINDDTNHASWRRLNKQKSEEN